jgi:hypothetical protein
MEGNEVAYSTFSFGKIYNIIEGFIQKNKLEEDVSLAISNMVIEELKIQKNRAYKKDIRLLKDIVKRLSGLPHVSEDTLIIPDESFDCAAFVEQKAQEFIQTKKINTLQHKDEDASSILNSMLSKIVGIDVPKSPFYKTDKYSDAGFKDNIIWETLMHFEKIAEYDKVIFLTKDGDYKDNCITDFENKWHKHVTIQKDENAVIEILKEDYEMYIQEREIYEYANSEYFKDYLNDLLKAKTIVIVDENEYAIENYKIEDYCKQIVRLKPDEKGEQGIVIFSSIKIFYTKEGSKSEEILNAVTILSDEETKEIYYTDLTTDLK